MFIVLGSAKLNQQGADVIAQQRSLASMQLYCRVGLLGDHAGQRVERGFITPCIANSCNL
jgi:hypothetical protein